MCVCVCVCDTVCECVVRERETDCVYMSVSVCDYKCVSVHGVCVG